MVETTFNTSELNDLDLQLINVLLTQAKNGTASQKAVIDACNFVLRKLEGATE